MPKTNGSINFPEELDMKTFTRTALFALVFSLFLTSEAMAFFPNGWSANVQISVQRTRMTATMVNRMNRPIVCRGKVFGRTASGVVLNSWVNNIVIWPGNFHHSYVHSNYADPIVNGWANVRCRWR